MKHNLLQKRKEQGREQYKESSINYKGKGTKSTTPTKKDEELRMKAEIMTAVYLSWNGPLLERTPLQMMTRW